MASFQFLCILLVAAELPTTTTCQTFTTRFEGTEFPLSEGGKWTNQGLDWARIGKSGGIAYGTQTGTNTGIYQYDDSYAHLSGFPPDQEAWGQARIAKSNPSCHQELEILLRWSSSAHRTTGYECFARCLNSDESYVQIVRCEGPLGKFTYLADRRGTNYGLNDGDILKASVVGNVIRVYINGVEKARVTDDTWKIGNPGIGEFLACDRGQGVGSNTNFGFSSFTARSIVESRRESAASDLPPSEPSALKTNDEEVTIMGSLLCNGACLPDPKADDHGMVLYAIDGTPEIQAEVAKIMEEFFPDKGLDAASATKVMDAFTARLKYYLSPQSPALPQSRSTPENHYCQPARASAVTGRVWVKDGTKWITASKIEPARLSYPKRMLAPDKPFLMPDRKPIVLKVTDALALKCVAIPSGTFLMGTPFYMWPYYVEEYPHVVTLTKPFYMAEIPVTQAMFEAVMGRNPSAVRDPQLPVQDPRFAEIDQFCEILSRKNGLTVRLPTDAEWEYAARVGTSNPGFPEKFQDQNSSGAEGFKAPLPVKSKSPNAWGLYDLASCWWEITADRGIYNVRHAEMDPRYPPGGADPGKVQRSGRGIIKDNWSIGTHEFITEKGYAGQKFRVVVEGAADKTE